MTAKAMPRRRAREDEWLEIGLGAQILRDLGITSIRLYASRERHYVGLEGFGIRIRPPRSSDTNAVRRKQDRATGSSMAPDRVIGSAIDRHRPGAGVNAGRGGGGRARSAWSSPARREPSCTRTATAAPVSTPASTFKLALSLIGFDSGFLKHAHDPVLTYQQGDPDWGGKAWTRPNDPQSWLRHSVVWYSQRITRALGPDDLTRRVASLDYGNADTSGDPGQDNGLERSWIASSLKISPVEQVRFLGRLIERRLPVDAVAIDKDAGDRRNIRPPRLDDPGQDRARPIRRRADRSF